MSKTWIIQSTSSPSGGSGDPEVVDALLRKIATETLRPFHATFAKTQRNLVFRQQHIDESVANLDASCKALQEIPNVLAYMPPHSAAALSRACQTFANQELILLGINGNRETISKSPYAFNIGVHDRGLRWNAIRKVAHANSLGSRTILCTDHSVDDLDGVGEFDKRVLSQTPDNASLQQLVLDGCNSSSKVIILNLSGTTIQRIVQLAGQTWSGKTVIRGSGSAAQVIQGTRTIDAVGFNSFPAPDGIAQLFERAIRKAQSAAVVEDLFTASWRIDAVFLLATALQSAQFEFEQTDRAVTNIQFQDVVRHIRQQNGVQSILEAPGRLIAFDSYQMNRARTVFLLDRSPDSEQVSLYPEQITPSHEWRSVTTLQFQPLWYGEVNEANGTFCCDAILTLWSMKPVDYNDLVFPAAVETPNITLFTGSTKALLPLVDNALHTSGTGYSQTIRLRGTFRFTPDISNYPLDSQEFSVAVELGGSSASDALQPLFVGQISPNLIEGWAIANRKVGRRNWATPQQADHNQLTWAVRDGVTFRIILNRTRRDAIPRTVLPTALIIGVTWLTSYWSDPEQVAAILVNALLACIGLYFSESKPIPGRTTLIDQLFMVCYGLIGLRLCAVIATFGAKNQTEAFQYINALSIWLIPIAIISFSLWGWLRFKRRR